MRGHRDLRAAVAAAALSALLALLVPFDPLSLVLALPLALFLPGFGITAAVFARTRIEARQTVVLSFGLSLAVLALGALVLNLAPGGIRGGSWALLLFVVVLATCRAAALRRPRAAPEAGLALLRWPRVNMPQAALFSAGAVAAIVAISLAFVPLSATHAVGYTEMWIQPLSGGDATGVRIGVGSAEQDSASYRLLVKLGANHPPIVRRFALKPGERKILSLKTPARPGTRTVSATATLFLGPRSTAPFRRVSTWIAQPRRVR